MRRRLSVAAGALLAMVLAASPATAVDVLLRSPQHGQPAFGEVSIGAEVLAGAPVTEVVFRVDGRQVGRLTEPPWRLVVDVGYDNVAHVFEVIAHVAGGASATARLETPAVRSDEEIDLELQQLYVTVGSGNGRYDLGLDRAAFRVRDGGKDQEIVTFERGNAPLTAVLLLDTSSSMQGERLRAAIEGAQAFVNGLRELDEAKLTLFSDRRIYSSSFSRLPYEVLRNLSRVAADGGTALNDHLYATLRLLDGRQGRRVAIVLSDGIDTDSLLAAEDVRWAMRRSQAMIYWIRLRDNREPGSFSSSWRSRKEHAEELATLERTVTESGGRVVEIGGEEQIVDAFSGVLHELRSQYVLGYYPSRNEDDGSWHRVDVAVRGHPRVRTRDGYIDY